MIEIVSFPGADRSVTGDILKELHLTEGRNTVASGEWFESIPHFFVQKMHRLLSCLKYQGRVLQEEREDKKNEYDCFNG